MNLLLESAVENEDSNIVAGGTLQATGAVREYAEKQQELTVTFGTTQGSYTERRNWLHKGKIRKYRGVVFMTPEIVKSNPSPIGIQTYAGGSAASVGYADITNAQRQHIQNALSPFGLSHTDTSNHSTSTQIEPLFVSSLYHIHPESTAKYLIETDPAFTNKRKFLSSDYMYRQMKWDQDKIPKRIGDGFYEQQLLADQILKQTGKRHLDGSLSLNTTLRATFRFLPSTRTLPPSVCTAEEMIGVWMFTTRTVMVYVRRLPRNKKTSQCPSPVPSGQLNDALPSVTDAGLRFSGVPRLSPCRHDSRIAIPRVLEHIVDTVLYFENERQHIYRILRAYKNRFGPTSEIGIFEMNASGLAEVSNPSMIFLGERSLNAPGNVVDRDRKSVV